MRYKTNTCIGEMSKLCKKKKKVYDVMFVLQKKCSWYRVCFANDISISKVKLTEKLCHEP